MSLVSETFQQKIFKQGEIILPQSLYSPTNKKSQEYFNNNQANRFAEKIKSKKIKKKKVDTTEKATKTKQSIEPSPQESPKKV